MWDTRISHGQVGYIVDTDKDAEMKGLKCSQFRAFPSVDITYTEGHVRTVTKSTYSCRCPGYARVLFASIIETPTVEVR